MIDRALSDLRGLRVGVAMSGGVDSAVAAARLRELGALPVGLSLRLHDPDPCNPLAPRACCPPDDLQDARRVAEHLEIPFYVIDARESFDEAVVRPFVASYLEGRTPNPCVGCNSFVKLQSLVRRARSLGCHALATGHFARVVHRQRRSFLYRGIDGSKDQSYFLFALEERLLSSLVFPLGAWTKAQVRSHALSLSLPVAHKLESQEVCFVGGEGAGRFVLTRPEAQGDHAGPILDEHGEVVGRHDGVMHFTVGQRKGIGLSAREPLHVLAIDAGRRAVTVGPATALMKQGLLASRASWPGGRPAGPVRAEVRIRYRGEAAPALVLPKDGDRVEVRFDSPVRAVSPGQAAVFYSGERVVGGAWIDEAVT